MIIDHRMTDQDDGSILVVLVDDDPDVQDVYVILTAEQAWRHAEALATAIAEAGPDDSIKIDFYAMLRDAAAESVQELPPFPAA